MLWIQAGETPALGELESQEPWHVGTSESSFPLELWVGQAAKASSPGIQVTLSIAQ